MDYFGRSQHQQGQGDEPAPDRTADYFNIPEAHHELNEVNNVSSSLYPTCALCNGPIHNIIVQAMDRTWHPQHFRCSHCHIPISTQKFHIHNDRPYCVEDYGSLFLKKCQGCKLTIKDVVVTALGHSWHPDHFVCVSCGTKLLYKGFYERENNAFCADCYEGKYCPKCHGCGRSITDTAIKVADKKWHEDCFKCARCRRLICGPTFRVSDAEVICVACGEERGDGEGKNDYLEKWDGE